MVDLNLFNQKLIEFETELANFKVLRYDEIPDIDLYMDQTIIFLNKRLKILFKNEESVVTPSMINNYVKAGIIPSPIGKKYSKKHLAYIICVCFFKQILSMNEIKCLIEQSKIIKGEEFSYNFFCEHIENSFNNCCKLIKSKTSESFKVTAENATLFYSCKAIANKLYAEKSISILQSLINEEKMKDIKKEVEKIKID